MATLTPNNSSIDKESGAVMFHKSPELLCIMELKQEIKEVNKKLDRILKLLDERSETDG